MGIGLLRKAWFAATTLMLVTAASSSTTSLSQPAPPVLSRQIAPLGFLVGSWREQRSQVINVRSSQGYFSFEPAINGQALLRRDHNDFVMKAGHDPAYDQIMLIYPEDGKLRGDWLDGQHVIHYTAIAIEPGRSVTFEGSTRSGGPIFRLNYRLGPSGVEVTFGQKRKGSRTMTTIATGVAVKQE